MFLRLAARETYVSEANPASRKHEMFLKHFKNICASLTQVLFPKHMFPRLATEETMFASSQCCALHVT